MRPLRVRAGAIATRAGTIATRAGTIATRAGSIATRAGAEGMVRTRAAIEGPAWPVAKRS